MKTPDLWPASLVPAEQQLSLVANTSNAFNRFSMQSSGAPLAQGSGARFELSLALRGLTPQQMREARAFLAARRGVSNRFVYPAYPGTVPAAPTGARRVAGGVGLRVARGAGIDNVLAVTGWQAATGERVIKRGAYLSFDDSNGDRKLCVLTEDSYLLSNGEAHLTVEPPVAGHALADTVVDVSNPSAFFVLKSAEEGAIEETPDRIYDLQLNAVQARVLAQAATALVPLPEWEAGTPAAPLLPPRRVGNLLLRRYDAHPLYQLKFTPPAFGFSGKYRVEYRWGDAWTLVGDYPADRTQCFFGQPDAPFLAAETLYNPVGPLSPNVVLPAGAAPERLDVRVTPFIVDPGTGACLFGPAAAVGRPWSSEPPVVFSGLGQSQATAEDASGDWEQVYRVAGAGRFYWLRMGDTQPFTLRVQAFGENGYNVSYVTGGLFDAQGALLESFDETRAPYANAIERAVPAGEYYIAVGQAPATFASGFRAVGSIDNRSPVAISTARIEPPPSPYGPLPVYTPYFTSASGSLVASSPNWEDRDNVRFQQTLQLQYHDDSMPGWSRTIEGHMEPYTRSLRHVFATQAGAGVHTVLAGTLASLRVRMRWAWNADQARHGLTSAWQTVTPATTAPVNPAPAAWPTHVDLGTANSAVQARTLGGDGVFWAKVEAPWTVGPGAKLTVSAPSAVIALYTDSGQLVGVGAGELVVDQLWQGVPMFVAVALGPCFYGWRFASTADPARAGTQVSVGHQWSDGAPVAVGD